MKKLCIEISMSWDSEEKPKHVEYCESFAEAEQLLSDLEQKYAEPRIQQELDIQIAEAEQVRSAVREQAQSIVTEAVGQINLMEGLLTEEDIPD